MLITFTAEGSFDPDQEIDGGELIYHWDLEGPVSPNMLNLGDKEDDRNFNFVFTEPGTYVATVSVYDERGGYYSYRLIDMVSYDGNNDTLNEYFYINVVTREFWDNFSDGNWNYISR